MIPNYLHLASQLDEYFFHKVFSFCLFLVFIFVVSQASHL